MSNIVIYQGESKTLTGAILDGLGEVFDGTGYELYFRAQLRKTTTAAIGPFVSTDVSPQISWISAALGTYNVDISETDSVLAIGFYECEVRIDDGAGGVETIVQFTIEIKDSQYSEPV